MPAYGKMMRLQKRFMGKSDKVLILALLLSGVLVWGCSHTIREKKGTGSSEGDITQLKFTGSKVKLEHDF